MHALIIAISLMGQPTDLPAQPREAITENCPYRTWTDSTGKFKIRARFVTVEAKMVVLEKMDSRYVRIPPAKLSKPDAELAAKLRAKQIAEENPKSPFVKTDDPKAVVALINLGARVSPSKGGQVRTVVLSQTNAGQIGVKELSHLLRLSSLDTLYLDGHKISGESTKVISKLPTIRVLSLQHCDLTSADVSQLAELTSLTYLRLKGNKRVTGSCLDALSKLHATLKRIEITDTGLTRQDKGRLTTLMPTTIVEDRTRR